MPVKTKIIGTIGPASSEKQVLEKLIAAGLNVARLNFSHGSYEDHNEVISRIRSISRAMNKPVGILLDLQGPKIRTGKLKDGEPVHLKKNGTVSITTRNIKGTRELISTTYKKLIDDVKKDEKILLDDGLIELKVISKTDDTVKCKIIHGGILKENKGINLPGIDVSAPSLTEKDKKDLKFGIQSGVDYFALSFVRKAEDLKNIKSIIAKQGSDIPVIAKIEKPEAVDNLDEILEVADCIMVARGDLGVELKPEQVPTIQKNIIQKAIKANKPVITATQMLESMTSNPIPTRAEASDVANAIFDGTDAIMLSGETASGKHPVKAVKMMTRIALEAESSPFMRYNLSFEKDMENLVTHAVAQSAVNILHEVDAKAIAAFSISGKTSKFISRQRPNKPVLSFTPLKKIYNRQTLVWGITPVLISAINDAQKLIRASENIIVDKQLVKENDIIVIVTGLALQSGSTNVIKIHRIGVED
ncbi:MAG: pyruvate kinase [Desulfobacterales bacterium]|nr:pyruvate kinase [Desulfobacteraceae bacterium]MBT7698444.1 pyruvate kinase [Desulfobacterales bacterium]